MASDNTKYKKVAELDRSARLKAGGEVADEDMQSLPIPLLKNDGLRIIFLFSPALARPKQPVKLTPPQYMLTLYAETGKLDDLRFVNPKDFGQTHDPDEMIGTFAMPEGMTTDAFSQKTDRLFEIYDMLLPEFVARKTTVNDDIKHAANEFRQLFTLLSEPPMRPYYGSVGRDFFTWVDNIAR